jgi:hypothetical protein
MLLTAIRDLKLSCPEHERLFNYSDITYVTCLSTTNSSLAIQYLNVPSCISQRRITTGSCGSRRLLDVVCIVEPLRRLCMVESTGEGNVQ